MFTSFGSDVWRFYEFEWLLRRSPDKGGVERQLRGINLYKIITVPTGNCYLSANMFFVVKLPVVIWYNLFGGCGEPVNTEITAKILLKGHKFV
jgi:hypothetical protein